MTVLSATALTGCNGGEKQEIVLTSEFKDDEILRIDTESCSRPELLVYLYSSADSYEKAFGDGIWDREIDGVTLGNELKDTTLARIAQVKSMNLLAADWGINLDIDEQADVKKAAETYYGSISDKEKSSLGITEEMIQNMYTEYAIADKVYNQITQNVNPEISDDEARTITVKCILIRSSSIDENGENVSLSEAEKAQAEKKAEEVLTRAQNGEDFDSLTEEYNEDSVSTYTFGKGTMPEAFEKAAFNLDTDEISGLVETEYGYHIIKCISTFNEVETDANKERIVKVRKSEAFNRVYNDFAKKLHVMLNRDLWSSIKMDADAAFADKGFFEVYDDVFGVN